MYLGEGPNSPGPKATPARRRPPNRPPNTRSPASKTYASESDVPSELPFPIEMPNGDGTGSPYATPQKSASNSPAPQTQSQSVNARGKARNANKPRPKSGFAPPSPAPARTGRRTPPNYLPAKSVTETAFAGATFHASPAPSSLPIPSFLAKAMDSPQFKTVAPKNQQPSPPLSDSEAPTPRQRSALAREVVREESPLDFLFNRQKEEQEQARRESSANLVASPPGPYSPPHAYVQSPPQPQTVPNKPPTILPRYDLLQRHSSGGRIPPGELSEALGQPMGPAFATPWAERMKKVQGTRGFDVRQEGQFRRFDGRPEAQFPSPRPPCTHQSSTSPVPDSKADALKKILAIGSPSPAAPSHSAPENIHPVGVAPQRLFESPVRPEQQRPYVPRPSETFGSPATRGPSSLDVQRMEDALRQVLKLDAGTTLSS